MKNAKVKQMVGVALLMAMVVVMQFISSAIPPIGGISISLVLIPIVVGAAVFGPMAGAILGGTFGVVTILNCITGADPGGQMVFQASPILCILVVMAKGVLAGLASGAVYALLVSRSGYIAMLFAAILCPIVNTGVFLLGMVLFFGDVLRVWANGSDIVTYMLSGIVLINFLPELLINVVFSPFAQRIVHFTKQDI